MTSVDLQSLNPEQRLQALGLVLPEGVRAAADYVPAKRVNNTLVLSGQTPRVGPTMAVRGRVGADVSLEDAQKAARICALRVLAIARDMLGSLDHIEQVVELVVYVRCAEDFEAQSQVADAASSLMVQVLGEAGRHARTAVGVYQLPGGAAVEMSAILAIKA